MQIGFVVAGAALVGVVMLSPLREMTDLESLRETLTTLRSEARDTWYAPLVFIAAYVIGAMCFIPATAFILTAAFFWGWLVGGFYAVIGAVVCAALSFELSRYVFGRLAERLFAERLPRLHKLFDHAGVRTVLFMRLVPGIPFPVFNFGAGLTALRSRDYIIGSAIGLTIPTFIVAFSADAIFAGTLERGQVAGRLVIAAVLMALLVLVPPIIGRRMRKDSEGEEVIDRDKPTTVVN